MSEEIKMDAAASTFFVDQLRFIKPELYNYEYPARKAFKLIPQSFDADEGSQIVAYESYKSLGIMQLIANYADDLPTIDVQGEQVNAPVFPFGGSYGYSTKDIRSAMMKMRMAGGDNTRVYLPTQKAFATRLAYDQFMNSFAWFGKPESSVYGLTNNPAIPSGDVPADGTGGSTTFESKTPTQILRDLNDLVNQIRITTKDVEMPDTVILPVKQMTYIASTPFSTLNGASILEYFKLNNPEITTVESVVELAGAGENNSDMMIAYRNDPMKLFMENPLPFTQYEPQMRNLRWVIPCEASTAGVIIPYPLSINIATGI